jgi:hypothetical protein
MFAGEGQGGAVFVATGFVSAVHCTIASNVIARSQSPSTLPPSVGGSAIFANGDTHPSIQNTILASASGLQTCFGPLTDLGGNLSSDIYANLTHPTSLSNVDPKLSPLDDYGGPTLTMALLQGSPAIDAAYMTANPIATDQRGRPRPTSAGADIGSFESTPPFTLRGQLTGYPSTAGIRVIVGDSNVVSDASGNYSFGGLSSGAIQVNPSHTNWVSDPLWRDVNVTRDTIGVSFEMFFKGLATLRKQSPTMLRVSYASRDPRVIVAETSSNLLHWIPIATNYTGLLLHVDSPIEPGSRFFRFSEGLPIPP